MINERRGSITVFLCIILTAMIALTGILTDAARIKASGVLSREAFEISSRSLLADYDRILKDYYGLFAMENSDEDALKENISEYVSKTLMTELGVSRETMGEGFYSKFLSIFLGNGSINNKDVFDLYDFQLDEVNVKPRYSLAQKEALERQILEQVKYRAPADVVEKLWERFSPFKAFGKQSATMDKKMKIDNDLDKAKDGQEELSDNVDIINAFDVFGANDKFSFKASEYNDSVKERIELEEKVPVLENEIDSIEDKLKDAKDKLKSLRERLSDIRAANRERGEGAAPIDTSGIEESISNVLERISELNSQLKQKENELKRIKARIKELDEKCFEIKELLNDRIDSIRSVLNSASNNVSKLKSLSKAITNKINDLKDEDLYNDNSDFATKIKQDINKTTSKLSLNKLNEVIEDINSNKNVTDILFSCIQITGDDLIDVNKVNDAIKNYAGIVNSNAINYKIPKSQNNTDTTDVREVTKSFEEEAKDSINKNLEADNSSEQNLKDSDLISKINISEDDFIEQDLKYIKKYADANFSRQVIAVDGESDSSLDSSELRNILEGFDPTDKESLSFSKSFSFINKIGDLVSDNMEDLRNKAYLDYYIQNIFKSRLSKDSSFQSTEKDLFGKLKKDRETFFDSELEYIIAGSKSEKVNNTVVEGQLLLTRFVLNTLAIYQDPTKYSDAYAAAAAIAGFTVLGVPIIQNLIMIGWAFAEAIIDVKLLVQGKEVPLYKTQGTWILDKTNAIKGILGEVAKDTSKAIIDYGKNKAETLTKSATSKIEEIIKTKINIAVDKAFAPIDNAFNTSNEYIDSFEEAVTVDIDENVSGDLKKIAELADQLAQQEFSNIGNALIETLRNSTVDEGEKKLQEVKADIRSRIYNQVEGLKAEIDKKIVIYVDKGAEELKKYVDSFDTGTNTVKTQAKLSSCLVSMNYQDYLSLFIYLTGRDKVLPRIADIIQLNIRKENANFDLAKSYTYVRVEGTVSIKYIFLGSMVKNETVVNSLKPRFTNDILLYQGY